eukprot:SAG31_NODE_19354_length_605_cov_0.667984_1_plen_134_part_01
MLRLGCSTSLNGDATEFAIVRRHTSAELHLQFGTGMMDTTEAMLGQNESVLENPLTEPENSASAVDDAPSSKMPLQTALVLAYAFHCCLCGGFFGLGVVLCMLGPTLLDLGEQSGATIQEMSLVFTARSVAYLA